MIQETAGSRSLQRVVLELRPPAGRDALVVQRVAGLARFLEGLEVLQHVAAVVVLLLVDLPAHAGLLQPLGVRRPACIRRRRACCR